jgi:VWFA-related protein
VRLSKYLLTGAAIGVVAGLGLHSRAQDKPPVQPPTISRDKDAAEKPASKQVGGLRFVDTMEITVVSVDVSVSNKKGPVAGLKAEDFDVYQDGRLQTLSNFGYYSTEGPSLPPQTPVPTVAAATPTPVAAEPTPVPPRREPRFLALYVDNENVMPFNRNRVITKLSDWVHDHLVAPDAMMVVSYQRSTKVLQPFTSDPSEVAEALRSMKKYTGGRSDALSGRRDVEDFINSASSSSSGNTQTGLSETIERARSYAREQHNNLTFTVRALQELIGTMSGLPGKKAIIYLSDGLPMSPGLELFYEIQDKFRDPGSLSSARDFDASDLFRGLVNTAVASGVTLYTIDARGLESELGMEAENRQPRSSLAAGIATNNYQDSLIYMANQTGGLAVLNANDPTPGLGKIAADLETYYSLGYRLSPSGQDRVHRIEVKVKGHPEYRLSYRKNFIERTLPTKISDRVVSGLSYDLQENPLGIELKTQEPAPSSNNRWTLPVEVRIPLDKIALIPDGNELVGYLMVYYAARDDEGRQSDLQRTEHVVRMPAKDYERSKRDYFTVTAQLLLNPGNYKISVGVRDELTNQAGYSTTGQRVHPEAQ